MAKKRFAQAPRDDNEDYKKESKEKKEKVSVDEDSIKASDPVVEEKIVEAVVEGEQVVVQASAQEPVTDAVVQPIVTPTPVQVDVKESKKGPYSKELTKLLSMCEATKNVQMLNYVYELIEYSKTMAPTQTMLSETGAANQAKLYNTLISIIDHTGNDFRLAYATTLGLFHEFKNGAFSGAYVLRFMENVNLNKQKRDTFIKLVNLISMTADPAVRKTSVKHVDFKRELLDGISEEGKMKITSFYMS